MAANIKEANTDYTTVAKGEIESFLQVTAIKSLQFAQRSSNWLESVFWIVLLVGATVLAIRDVRKAYQEYTYEETYTSMHVTGLQRLTFDDAIVCVEYDPRALNLSNARLIKYAEKSALNELAKETNSTSATHLLNRLLKLITAMSLTENGRRADYELKVRELQRGDNLQQLQDWLIKQRVDINYISAEVASWLCLSLRIRIDTIKRGNLLSATNPCKHADISWLGVIPFASIASSETTVCVEIAGLIVFESMFDRVVISVLTEDFFRPLSANENESSGYSLNSYVDFSGDPVSTDMTKDYITFPTKGCLSFEIAVGAKLKLIDRWMARCNTTAKTRFECYAGCDTHLYAGTNLSNCTQLAWLYHNLENRPMCFDLFSIEAHVESRQLTERTNVTSSCFTSCLFPCEYRQYDISHADECYKDYANAYSDGVSIELRPKRFTVPAFEEHFAVDLSDLFSRLGGTCGLWLGVGLLGICHALLFPLKLLAKLLLRRNCSKRTAKSRAAIEQG